MRTNLLALLLILVLVAIVYRNDTAPQPPKIEWEASFWLSEPNGFGAGWVDIENDRYLTCLTGCTSASVVDRGRVQRSGNHINLLSDQGTQQSYSLAEDKSGRSLRDSAGHIYPERDARVPRLHPAPTWLSTKLPLELADLSVGMNRSEVLRRFPKARPDGDGALVAYLYPESDEERVTIVIDGHDKVIKVGGIRLSQHGRPLLNECSTRRDVECLFGRLRWDSEPSGSHGYSATAYYGRLKIEVHSLAEMKHEEARLVNLTLAI